ncbi:SPFH domain-containing protein [Paucibacter sp. APW11]|uniref:SPFH domain-containing protein n=1 Tax=Roseateles aquae TaxID=3077235 RepID=A0ABU3PBA7_9BURK|nr:SPFH domain-containing protein [Paucibacter sp. APW11]MDT8999846.1 SPFH domain-containing protein [Paucibacter sp. APW11]
MNTPRLNRLSARLSAMIRSMRQRTVAADDEGAAPQSEARWPTQLKRASVPLLLIGSTTLLAWALFEHSPVQGLEAGELGIRSNQLTGSRQAFQQGSVLVLPGLHQLHRYSLRDQSYQARDAAKADGAAPFQSLEGLSLGVDLRVRYALEPSALMARALPQEVDRELVEPAVQGLVYRVMARYTVREIFSSKRAEIQAEIETELKKRLATEGVLVRAVQMGNVDLPADYRHGLEGLLAEELRSEKMRFTLELKEKQVRQTALEAEAEGVRRAKAAEASAQEQIIAARAQEEAMKHVLPFKQRQIERRALEAEADKQSRIRTAEGSAQARRIEASGEADSRQKLADAEVYRVQRLAQASSEQMARDGALISKHPLLIQKALADKLSDKIQVIIAPPSADGGFIAAGLLGKQAAPVEPAKAEKAEEAQQ